eukprot:299877-Rhodomonas_salina.6
MSGLSLTHTTTASSSISISCPAPHARTSGHPPPVGAHTWCGWRDFPRGVSCRWAVAVATGTPSGMLRHQHA